MKKILINFVTLHRNGIDAPRLLKFKELEALGCELHLFSGKFIKKIQLAEKDIYSFNETISEFKNYAKMRWTKMKFLFFAFWMNVRGLFFIRKILGGGYDVIYSPASVLDMVIIPRFVKIFERRIVWVSVLDNIVPFRDPGNKFIRFLSWIFFKLSLWFLKKADVIFVISKELQRYLLERGFPARQIVLTANGVDNELIEKSRADNTRNIDALFMGRINETKGIYDMLKALDIVRKKYPSFQFAVMGEGDEATKRKFKKRIREMGLTKNIQFLGFQTGIEKFNIIKSAKCFWFLSVSESESFGVSLLEAVCCGLPAFAYDLPQFSWLYPNGEVDISPKGDWKTVAEKVIRLFEKGDFRNPAGEKLLGKYSWEEIAKIEYNAINNIP